jgi:hypothetical protein
LLQKQLYGEFIHWLWRRCSLLRSSWLLHSDILIRILLIHFILIIILDSRFLCCRLFLLFDLRSVLFSFEFGVFEVSWLVYCIIGWQCRAAIAAIQWFRVVLIVEAIIVIRALRRWCFLLCICISNHLNLIIVKQLLFIAILTCLCIRRLIFVDLDCFSRPREPDVSYLWVILNIIKSNLIFRNRVRIIIDLRLPMLVFKHL